MLYLFGREELLFLVLENFEAYTQINLSSLHYSSSSATKKQVSFCHFRHTSARKNKINARNFLFSGCVI